MIDIFVTPLLWSIFFLFLTIMFIIDYYIDKKNKIEIKCFKDSFFYYFHWFFLSLFFVLILWCISYKNNGMEIANTNITLFFTGYLLEILLSIDNVFIWFLIFKSFKIPKIFQRKVLLYGVWSAIILRSLIIFYGKILFLKYHWILYFFGVIFLWTSVKIIFRKNKNNSMEKSIDTKWIFNIFRVTKYLNNEKFFCVVKNKLFITPLFVSLITIEISDIVFAIDSIPAIFSITDNFFIIFTSNIFSILGLRSMYFFISLFIEKYPEIEYGLSGVLVFIACKILLEKFFIISTFITLLVILTILIFTFIIKRILDFQKQ